MTVGIAHRKTLLKSLPYLSFGFLTLATGYTAWYANYYLSGGADDIVYPYLFKHFRLHDMILPSQHTNILKFPLFIAQAILPYDFTTFTIVNIGLVLITILVWAGLLVWLFGRRYAALICMVLASLLLGSVLLDNDLLGTTIRNIEYPIALAFIIYTGIMLPKQKLLRKDYLVGIVLGILYALTVAGDSFFLYTVPLAMLATLALFRFVSLPAKQRHYRFGQAAAYIIGSVGVAIVVREAVKVFGIARYFTDSEFLPHVLPLNHLAPSISTTTTQVLNLFDANIFGQKVMPTNSLVFLNFLLLGLGLAGWLYAIRDVFGATRRKALLSRLDFPRVFILGVLALLPFVIYLLYILSDLAVIQMASGAIVSANQERYLTMLPLLAAAGIAYLAWRNFNRYRVVVFGLPLVILAGILINAGGIRHSHFKDASERVGPIAVAQALETNHIPLLVSGYWYGSPTRFWSHDSVMYSTAAFCNTPDPPINTRLSWYVPSASIHRSALLVARTGINASYSTCPDQMLEQVYGKPSQVIHVNSPDSAVLWVYNYDIRSKFTPLVY